MISIESEAITKLEKSLNSTLSKIKVEVGKEVALSALYVEGHIKKKISRGRRTGIAYPRAGGRIHIASAPYEPPKTDTGHLVKSVGHNKKAPLEYDVVPLASYAEDLEYGSFRAQPRPFIRPTVQETEGKIVKKIKRAIIRGVND